MRPEEFFRAGGCAVWAAGLLLCVSGCGGGSSPAPASGHSEPAHTAKAKQSPVKPGELELTDMVSAVSASKPGPPIELKFALPTRPEVGQPMDIDIAVIPRAPVPDSVSVSFQVVDGLEIIEGSQLQRVDRLVDGAPIRHVVRILPKRDGIFAVTAVASFVVANQDSSRTFSIPVIAGEGLPEQVAKGP